jgi:hypothetical protein
MEDLIMKGLKFFLAVITCALLLGTSFPAGSQTSSGSLYADFGPGVGLYHYDDALWTQLASGDPLAMAASGSLLYGNFVSGLYKYDGATWTQLSPLKPTKMVAAGSLLYADFGSPYGVYMYDGANWTPLTSSSPQDMTIPVNPNIITDGNYNTAIGINAFKSNTTGHLTPPAEILRSTTTPPATGTPLWVTMPAIPVHYLMSFRAVTTFISVAT